MKINNLNVFNIGLIGLLILICVGCQGDQRSVVAKRLIGVWTVESHDKGFVEREFSWGVGKYIPNDSIIIDYSEDKSAIVIQNPGLGSFFIESVERNSIGAFTVNLRKKNINDVENLPEKGSIDILFKSDDMITIDDSKYMNMFGLPPGAFLQKNSP